MTDGPDGPDGPNEPTHKQCTECKQWKRISLNPKESEFYTAGVSKNGIQQWGTRCKPCDRAVKRAIYHEGRHQWEHKKAYSRARSRALTRLKRLVPELYEMVLEEELAKDGVPYTPKHSAMERRSVIRHAEHERDNK